MAPSPAKILIVALILLLLFGSSRLAQIGRGLGEGIRNFKKGIDPEGESGDDKQAREDTKRLTEGEGSSARAPAAPKGESA